MFTTSVIWVSKRIFSAFEQADASTKRRHGGLGLGLHVARRLAVAMGGDVSLETEEGRGSRFTVRIEAPRDKPASTPSQPAAAAASDVTDAAGREILCVDDNHRNLYVIGAMLRAAGHRATECDSGAEALALLAARKFDVVMLDMVMPDMDGLETLTKLRAGGGPNADTPVIACTANVLPDQVEAYKKAGTANVLAKPIDARAMLTVSYKLMDGGLLQSQGVNWVVRQAVKRSIVTQVIDDRGKAVTIDVKTSTPLPVFPLKVQLLMMDPLLAVMPSSPLKQLVESETVTVKPVCSPSPVL